MKKKKLFFLNVIIILLFFTAGEACGISAYKFYQKLVKREKIGMIKEYWTKDLTTEILESRGDNIIVEKCIGKCINNKKDGEILGIKSPYNYISYRSVKNFRIHKGDIILTVFIYQPGNKYTDDIVCRFDYIIDSKYHIK